MSKALIDKKHKLEQQKAKISLQEAKLKLLERKARTRRLIELGGLIAKSELDKQPNNVLYGMLLEAKDKLKNDAQLKEWAKRGGKAFASEQKEKLPVILIFDDKPPVEARNTVRAHGLKWNNIRKEWHGLVENINQLKHDISPFPCHITVMRE